MLPTILHLPPKNERQQRVNIFQFCILDNQMAMQRCYATMKILATFMGKNAGDHIATTSIK